MRDDDWSKGVSRPIAASAGPRPVQTIAPNQRPRRYREKNGPAAVNCASLPSNLFRAVQGRTLMFTLKAFIALVVTWCLLAVAAVVAASTQRFEGLYMYLVAAAVLVGLVIVAAIAIAP